jgi:hypothetical protein
MKAVSHFFKFSFALVFVCFLFPNIAAQKLISPNKWWKIKHEIFPQGNQTVWHRTYSVSNDTSIGGMTYSKIATQDSIHFYVRENNDSVFFLENGSELMLYNFNMQLGDSVSLNSNFYGSYFYKATAIDSVLRNGVYLKRITVQTNRSHPQKSGIYQLTWVKGIGDNDYGIMSLYIVDLGFGPSLVCVGELNSSIFTGCPLSVAEESVSKAYYFYNGEKIITTQDRNTDLKIFLFDLSGRMVFECKSKEALYLFPAHTLPKGIYILKAEGSAHTHSQRLAIY